MSWAARNSSSRVAVLKPFITIAAWAAERRSASIAIQFLNSPERPASAFSARPTGSSRSHSGTRRNTLRNGLGCVITCGPATPLPSRAAGFSFAMVPSLPRLDSGPRLVEQRGLLHHFHFAADAALGADIGVG